MFVCLTSSAACCAEPEVVLQTYGQSNMLRAWYTGKSLYMFPTASIPLTSSNIIKVLSQVPDINAFYGVPLAFKLLAEMPEGLQVLKRLKLVMFGGSACPDELGDLLVSEGVRLVAHYGLSTFVSCVYPCVRTDDTLIS